jgi:hypothetical protein
MSFRPIKGKRAPGAAVASNALPILITRLPAPFPKLKKDRVGRLDSPMRLAQ